MRLKCAILSLGILSSAYVHASECSDPKVKEIALKIVSERTNITSIDVVTKQLLGVQIAMAMVLNPPLAKDLINLIILDESNYSMDHIVTVSHGVCKANFSATDFKLSLNPDIIAKSTPKDLTTFKTLLDNINKALKQQNSSTQQLDMKEYTVETTDDGEYLVTVQGLPSMDQEFENLRTTINSVEYQQTFELFETNTKSILPNTPTTPITPENKAPQPSGIPIPPGQTAEDVLKHRRQDQIQNRLY
jgi:hypothetical protein